MRSLRKPPRKSELDELKEDLAEAQDRVYRYETMLVDIFHSGAFTLDELGKIRYVAEYYDCWIP